MIIVDNLKSVSLVRNGFIYKCAYNDIDWSVEYDFIVAQIIDFDRIRLEKLGDKYLLDFDGGTLS